jgi:uncharacterized DUF497 family protein
MNIRETKESLGLDPDSRSDHGVFVEMLDSGKVASLPDELVGLAVSRNKRCQWYKKKAYINRWKHQVSFEFISRLFEDPPPSGFEVLYEEYDQRSTGMIGENADDERERLLVRIDPRHYVVVKIGQDFTRSGLVHLISARLANTKEVEAALRAREVNGSVHRLQAVLDGSEAYDYYGNLPKYHGDVSKFVSIYSHFMSGDSVSQAVEKLFNGGFGLSYEEAESVVHDWSFNRNVKYLAGIMRWI